VTDNLGQDLTTRILRHRLKQSDLEPILQSLQESDREKFVVKISDIMGKLTALLDVASKVSDTLSLDTLLARMMEITSAAAGADRSTLFLNDAETGELFSRVAQGEGVAEIRFPNHLGIAGSVFTTGQTVIIEDAYADARFNPEVDKKTGYRTRNILCAPLRTMNQEIIGVTQLLNKKTGAFTDDDAALLEAITSQAASSLLNAQLFEQVQKNRDEETRLLDLNSAISSELNLEPLLQKIMTVTTELLDADRSTLFLYDKKTGELWSRVAQGLQSREIRFPSHLGIAGSVFTNGKTINIPDAYQDKRFNPEVDKKTGYRTKSILCMPVINREGRILGVTQVLNKRGGPFTEQDEKRLRSFSAQASISIENAQLFDDVLNMKNYNESILESLSNGVITLDEENRVAKCNSAAARIFKFDPPSLVEKPVAEVFLGPNQWVVESVKKVQETGQPDIALDMDITLEAGGTISINLTAVNLIDIHGERIGSMLVVEDISKEKRLKGTMARYLTKEVADQLLESGQDALGGRDITAAVLFSDIRSFTTLSEKLGPQETVSMLNDYFTVMVDVIFNNGGILDKYIGDAIMAVFGVPFSGENDSDHAVRAGVEMLTRLREFNQARLATGKDPILIGIGISTDTIVSGNIGSPKRMDYTVIGDGVNLASRLEGANKFYGTNLLVSQFCFERLGAGFLSREIDLIKVKGKTRPVAVYEIMDHYDRKAMPQLEEIVGIYGQALNRYRQRDWPKAMRQFEKALALYPNDKASALYLERCQYFEKNPPSQDWDGVWTMTSK